MSWSDEARAAAAEARRRKSMVKYKVMDAGSGMTTSKSRAEIARSMRSLRARLRSGLKMSKRDTAITRGQISNLRSAVKKGNISTGGTTHHHGLRLGGK